ncbi:MAG: SDR family oxidoreductase [Desulfobacteraceae bacterium]
MVSNSRSLRQRPNLLVTGASGNLGCWVCRLAAKNWTVTGIHWQHAFSMDGVESVQADLTDLPALEDLMAAVKPKAVIHAAAVSQPAFCEQHPNISRLVNVDVPRQLATLCADLQIPFIFTSTDLVFDGSNAPYTEHDTVTPVCVYGLQKAEAETAVLSVNGNALVCRLPLMIGVGAGGAGGFSAQMLFKIQRRRPLRLFTDEFRTPVTYRDAAKGLLSLVGKARGCLHLGGRTRISRYDLGLLMAEQMGVAPTMIEPMTLESINTKVARSPDCSLVSDRAYALGYDPAPLPKAIQWVVGQLGAHLEVSTTRRRSS